MFDSYLVGHPARRDASRGGPSVLSCSHARSSTWLIILAPSPKGVNAYELDSCGLRALLVVRAEVSRSRGSPAGRGRSQRGPKCRHSRGGEGGMLRGGNTLENLTRSGGHTAHRGRDLSPIDVIRPHPAQSASNSSRRWSHLRRPSPYSSLSSAVSIAARRYPPGLPKSWRVPRCTTTWTG